MAMLPQVRELNGLEKALTRDLSAAILLVTSGLLMLVMVSFFLSPNRDEVGFYLGMIAAWMTLAGWVESTIAFRESREHKSSLGRSRVFIAMVLIGFTLSFSLLSKAPFLIPILLTLGLLGFQLFVALSSWQFDRRQTWLMVPLILSTIALENVIARAIGSQF